MALLSPGVIVKEKDYSTIVPNVASAIGGVAGIFKKGPINSPVLVTTEDELYQYFGAPYDDNAGVWFSAAEFLKYADKLWVVRAAQSGALNAAALTPKLINNASEYENTNMSGVGQWIAKQPGITGNNVSIIMVDQGNYVTFKNDTSAFSYDENGNHYSSYFNYMPTTTKFVADRSTVKTAASTYLSGSLTGYGTLVFNSGDKTLTRTTGSWTAAGIVTGSKVVISGAGANNGTFTVTNAAALVLTFAEAVSDATSTSATLFFDKFGTVTFDETGGVFTIARSVGSWVSDGVTNGASVTVANSGSNNGTFTVTTTTASTLTVSQSVTDEVYTGTTSPNITFNVASTTVAPNLDKRDELHILVVDRSGAISGKPGMVLEKFEGLSKASDAMDFNTTPMYYAEHINSNSKYVYFANHPTSGIESTTSSIFAWGNASYDVGEGNDRFAGLTAVNNILMTGGVAGNTPTTAEVKDAYDQLGDVDIIDVNLLITGNHDSEVCRYVIENVAYKRKDAVAFVSPMDSTHGPLLVGKTTGVNDAFPSGLTKADIIAETVKYRTGTTGDNVNIAEMYASYGVCDSGWKYLYDKYNLRYRWVPLNGDVAGLVARTEVLAEPWYSPGGFNRGGIKNVIKLNINPTQAQRDILYPANVNPVVIFPAQGPVLFGDKTMQTKPSAFDRINVRRLFCILEKAIAIAAKYQLFEFNDTFTRATFRNMVEPYLRDVQGRRGIYDFKVVCDETNNTGEIIDRNEFVADIYIKPARSINYITLNFIATKTGVSFSQVMGG